MRLSMDLVTHLHLCYASWGEKNIGVYEFWSQKNELSTEEDPESVVSEVSDSTVETNDSQTEESVESDTEEPKEDSHSSLEEEWAPVPEDNFSDAAEDDEKQDETPQQRLLRIPEIRYWNYCILFNHHQAGIEMNTIDPIQATKAPIPTPSAGKVAMQSRP